ncbi:MAG: type II secretion system protein [Peptoniphilus sp.]|nr:type II secretion system protein [Peptoniphilus sp.]
MKKGFILIDLLISIALLSIIATVLLQSYADAFTGRKNLQDRLKMYNAAKNQMELITAANYKGGRFDVILSEEYQYTLEEVPLSENLNKYILKVKDEKNHEIKIEKILYSKGLHPH